jgi:hypothetical protein
MGTRLFDIIQATILDLHRSHFGADVPDPVVSRKGLLEEMGRYNPVTTSPDAFAKVALLKALCKKYVGKEYMRDVPERARNEAAKEKFLAANQRCCVTNATLDELFSREHAFSSHTPMESYLLTVLGEARRFICDYLLWYQDVNGNWTNSVPIRDLYVGLRDGPGASAGVSGETFYDKNVAGPLTYANPDLLAFFDQALNTTSIRYSENGLPKKTLLNTTTINAEKRRRTIYGERRVRGSKLGYAKKNWDISRTTCSEPCLEMKFQLSLGQLLADFLKRIGFDLSTQEEVNRALAKRASQDGRSFTMDQSSASDLVCLRLVKYLFPEDWYGWFMATRSQVVVDPSTGREIKLHMISSMGNGFTFAVESIVFLALLVGTCKVERVPITWNNHRIGLSGNIGIFGDDIIGPTAVYHQLRAVYDMCGFIVNEDKSFHTGCFRESCGGDYYDGRNVRGVYCRGLDTAQDRFSLINRLIQWGGEHGVSFELTSRNLLYGLPLLLIPLWEDDCGGLKVPYALAQASLRRLTITQYWEIIGPDHIRVPKEWGSKPVRPWCSDQNPSELPFGYRILVVRPVKEKLYDLTGKKHKEAGEYTFTQRGSALQFNPDGMMLCVLKGVIGSGSLIRRTQESADQGCTIRLRAALGWDCLTPGRASASSHVITAAYSRALHSSLGWVRVLTEE